MLDIKKTIDQIEDNLYCNININDFAEMNYISIMQLYRDFYSHVGYSVKEYIRNRRLSQALQLIKHSDLSFVAIAYKCGYSSQQAMCRKIKKNLGVTASIYKNSNAYYCFPRFSSTLNKQIKVESETIPQVRPLIYMDSRLAGIERRALEKFHANFPDYKGRIFGKSSKQIYSRFIYELGVEYEKFTFNGKLSVDFKLGDKTNSFTQLFAKTTVDNNEDDINKAWDFLYNKWIKSSMFEHDNTPYFEEYINSSIKPKKLKLYLPIRKKEKHGSIKIVTNEKRKFLVSIKKGKDAERTASNEIISYLIMKYPEMLEVVKEYIVEKTEEACICGIAIKNDFIFTPSMDIREMTLPEGKYAVIEDDCVSDFYVYSKLLSSWVAENGLAHSDNRMF